MPWKIPWHIGDAPNGCMETIDAGSLAHSQQRAEGRWCRPYQRGSTTHLL